MDNREKVYKYIVDYMTENQYAPSIREICKGVGLKSTSSVHMYLMSLKKAGLIDFSFDQARTIKLIGYKLIKE